MNPMYVVCIDNAGYAASLEVRKIYERIGNYPEDEDCFVRVIDESGEDYLYPATKFVAIELPAEVREALRSSSEPR